jgi:hypothetical protein
MQSHSGVENTGFLVGEITRTWKGKEDEKEKGALNPKQLGSRRVEPSFIFYARYRVYASHEREQPPGMPVVRPKNITSRYFI